MAAIQNICQIISDTRKNLFEIQLILREGTEDMKNILVIFNLMLVTSASTAAAECGFSKLNI